MRHSALKERSAVHVVTGRVPKFLSTVCMFGNKVASQSARAPATELLRCSGSSRLHQCCQRSNSALHASMPAKWSPYWRKTSIAQSTRLWRRCNAQATRIVHLRRLRKSRTQIFDCLDTWFARHSHNGNVVCMCCIER